MAQDPPSGPRYPAREVRAFILRWLQQVYGVLLGLLTGPLLLLGLLLRRRRPSFAARTIRWERLRLDKRFRISTSPGAQSDTGQDHVPGRAYVLLSAAAATGSGLFMFYMLTVTTVLTLGTLTQLIFSGPATVVVINFTTWQVNHPVALVGLLYVMASVVAVCGISEVSAWLSARIAATEFTVQRRDALRARIGELVTTRRGVVQVIDDERRRIERDLHDGAQQNVVSLSMLIARARRTRDPQQAQELLDVALAQSQDLIQEMREVAWRIYPTALDELGLERALAHMVKASALDVELDSNLQRRPPQHVESVAFFVAAEALTNAVKHSGAQQVRIVLEPVGAGPLRRLRVMIDDDGRGGADPHGSGLRGLARRVAALDGTFTVSSPPGGPTTITAELPDD